MHSYVNHKNLKTYSWLPHEKILDLYKQSSISIVPSRWDEPFGRTSMESAAYGCAVITSNKGGLPETFKNDLTGNAGHIAMNSVFFNGMKAMGIKRERFFQKGYYLNFLEINKDNPNINTCENDNLINTILYGGDIRMIKNTYTKGLLRNDNKKDYLEKYSRTIKKIKASI